MNNLKSAFARTVVALAFVISGCASLGPSDNTSNFSSPYDSPQYGGF